MSRVFSVSNPREVWLITAAHGVNEFYSVALPPILPLLVNDFAISYAQAGILLTVFYATYSVFQLPAGILADRIGQRWLLSAGMVLLSIGILMAAIAPDYWTLVGAEVLAGVGGSTYHPSGMSLISDLETTGTEGKAMGIHGLGGVVGTALAPVLIGGIAVIINWRVALMASATVGITYAIVFLALFRNVKFPAVDNSGNRSARESTTTAQGTSETRWSTPRALFTVPLEPWVGVLFLANLMIATETGAVRTFITSYLVDHSGTTTGLANGIFFTLLVGAGAASLGGGVLADLMDRTTIGILTMSLSTLVLGATWFIPPTPIVLFVWFFLLGFILWAAIPIMNAITSQYSQREFSGSLFAVLLTAGSLGAASGPLLFGVLAEHVGLGGAFPLMASVSLVGIGAFLLMRRL